MKRRIVTKRYNRYLRATKLGVKRRPYKKWKATFTNRDQINWSRAYELLFSLDVDNWRIKNCYELVKSKRDKYNNHKLKNVK